MLLWIGIAALYILLGLWKYRTDWYSFFGWLIRISIQLGLLYAVMALAKFMYAGGSWNGILGLLGIIYVTGWYHELSDMNSKKE